MSDVCCCRTWFCSIFYYCLCTRTPWFFFYRVCVYHHGVLSWIIVFAGDPGWYTITRSTVSLTCWYCGARYYFVPGIYLSSIGTFSRLGFLSFSFPGL